MHPGKIILIVAWAYGLGSFFIGSESTAAHVGRMIFWGMAGIHLIECAIFFPTVRCAGGPVGPHLARIFAWGFLHLQEIGAFGKPADPGE